jgi:hypothetical protein
MAKITEIAPSIFCISIYAQRGDVQFNHFLVKDDDLDAVFREIFGREKPAAASS